MIPNASFHDLPEPYKLKIEIDMKKNKKEFWGIQIGALFLLVPFVLPVIWGWLPVSEAWTLLDINRSLWLLLLLQIPMIVVHEAIHGIVYKLGTDRKVIYKFHGFAASASVPGTYFTLPHYLKVGLAPAVILSGLFLVLTLLSSGLTQWVWYLMLAVHFGSCVGDFYVTLRIWRLPKDSLNEDYGIGMRIYTKD